MRTTPHLTRSAHGRYAMLLALWLTLCGLSSPASARIALQPQNNLVTATLRRADDASLLGSVFLSATADDETFVWAILAKAAPLTIALYEGSCDEPDAAPAHELSGFDAAGESETLLDVALDEILAAGHVIKIHESESEAGEAIACQAIEIGNGAGGSLKDTAIIARNDDVLYRPLAGEESRLTLEARQAVQTGDAINVRERGEGWLTFPDYLIVRIFRDTDMGISVEGEIDPETPPIIEVELRGGTVFGSRPDPAEVAEQRVTITTAGAVITTTGTKFLVHVDRDSEATWVLVASGEVQMEGAGETVTVPAGWQSWTIPGEEPLAPVPGTRAMVEALFPEELPLLDDLTIDALEDEALLGDKTCVVKSPQGLRLRSGAGTSFERLESMPDGSEFRASLWNDDLAWTYGTSETGQAGWASSNFLECAWPPPPLVSLADTPVVRPTSAPPSIPTVTPTAATTTIGTPTPPPADSDGDGWSDDIDNCWLEPNDQADWDMDNVGDACADFDGDGATDALDTCLVDYNPGQEDIDGDGVGDACDDSDGDSAWDSFDNCIFTYNPGQEDSDLDDIGDACDSDVDGDSVSNDVDKCPLVYDPEQQDWDNDGIGTACDDFEGPIVR